MTSRWKLVLPVGVLAVLLLAGGVFGVRSWLGVDDAVAAGGAPASERVVPTRSPAAPVVASPTPTPERTEKPRRKSTPKPSPTPTQASTEPPATPTPTPAARTTRSTAAAASQIKTALDARGKRTLVSCPATVAAAVGTRFSCTVAYASAPSTVVADARVRITSAEGTFTWTSVSRG